MEPTPGWGGGQSPGRGTCPLMTSQGGKGDKNRSRGRTFLISGVVSSLEGSRRRSLLANRILHSRLLALLISHCFNVKKDDNLHLKILFIRQTCTFCQRLFFQSERRDLVRITIITRRRLLKSLLHKTGSDRRQNH